MRLRHFLPVFLLSAIISCAPTASETSPIEFTDPTIEFAHNVSGLYGIASISTGTGIELQWKDSTGRIISLSDHQGKPVLVAFLRLMDSSGRILASQLDSVQREMIDSVFVLAIVEDNSPHSFASAAYYDSILNLHLQLVSDSAERAHIQFVQLTGRNFVHPESYLLKKDGHLAEGSPFWGYQNRFYWEEKLRQLQ
jgi:hypothetical protein